MHAYFAFVHWRPWIKLAIQLFFWLFFQQTLFKLFWTSLWRNLLTACILCTYASSPAACLLIWSTYVGGGWGNLKTFCFGWCRKCVGYLHAVTYNQEFSRYDIKRNLSCSSKYLSAYVNTHERFLLVWGAWILVIIILNGMEFLDEFKLLLIVVHVCCTFCVDCLDSILYLFHSCLIFQQWRGLVGPIIGLCIFSRTKYLLVSYLICKAI